MLFSLLDFTRDNILSMFGLVQYTGLFIFELIDIIIMSLAIGYLFSDVFKSPIKNDDPIAHYKSETWNNIKHAAMIAGVAVVLHELAHKFVAMAFGAQAVLYAPYGFYLFVILLKLVGFPLLFFVGGFVAHTPLPYGESAIVALAGPLVNIILWGGITLAIKHRKIKKKGYLTYAVPFAKLNLFLGIFNLIPIPGFDGWSVFYNLFKLFF